MGQRVHAHAGRRHVELYEFCRDRQSGPNSSGHVHDSTDCWRSNCHAVCQRVLSRRQFRGAVERRCVADCSLYRNWSDCFRHHWHAQGRRRYLPSQALYKRPFRRPISSPARRRSLSSRRRPAVGRHRRFRSL